MYLPTLTLALLASLPFSTARPGTALLSPSSHLWGCARCIVPDPDNKGISDSVVDQLLSLTAHCAKPKSDEAMDAITTVKHGASLSPRGEWLSQYEIHCLVKTPNDENAEENTIELVDEWEKLCKKVRLEGSKKTDGKRRNGYGFVMGSLKGDLPSAAQSCAFDAAEYGGMNLDEM